MPLGLPLALWGLTNAIHSVCTRIRGEEEDNAPVTLSAPEESDCLPPTVGLLLVHGPSSPLAAPELVGVLSSLDGGTWKEAFVLSILSHLPGK